jgi:hypothetical protein
MVGGFGGTSCWRVLNLVIHPRIGVVFPRAIAIVFYEKIPDFPDFSIDRGFVDSEFLGNLIVPKPHQPLE